MEVPLERVLRNFNQRIEQPVQKHLKNVYACLTMSGAVSAAGAYANMYFTMFSGFFTAVPAVGFLLALYFTRGNDKNNKLRLGYLAGFAFFTGIGLGPLINYAVAVNPSIVVSALLGTVLIFSCFTASVLFSPRGYWLFLAGPITTLLSAVFLLSLAYIVLQTQWLFQINIYVGLLAMCGFVIYDTTIIMEKCRMNDKDFISHSVDLFIDFIGIFKRLLIILIMKEKKLNNQSKNK